MSKTSGTTPKDCEAPPASGVHFVPVKNSPTPTSPKNTSVSSRSEKTIPVVVRTETSAAASRA